MPGKNCDARHLTLKTLHIILQRRRYTLFSSRSEAYCVLPCLPQRLKSSSYADSVQVSRMLYRARQRGFLELDLLVGMWAEQHVPSMDRAHLDAFQDVLEQENPDMFKWITGQAAAPPSMLKNPVFKVSTVLHLSKPTLDLPPETMTDSRHSGLRACLVLRCCAALQNCSAGLAPCQATSIFLSNILQTCMQSVCMHSNKVMRHRNLCQLLRSLHNQMLVCKLEVI